MNQTIENRISEEAEKEYPPMTFPEQYSVYQEGAKRGYEIAMEEFKEWSEKMHFDSSHIAVYLRKCDQEKLAHELKHLGHLAEVELVFPTDEEIQEAADDNSGVYCHYFYEGVEWLKIWLRSRFEKKDHETTF